MRIAVLAAANIDGFPVGGTSSFLRTILPYLAQRHSLAFVGLDGIAFPSSASFQFPGKGSVDLLSRHMPTRVSSLNKAWQTRSQLRDWSPSVIYAHSPELAALGHFLVPACPCVLHLHGVANPLNFSRFPWARTRVAPKFYDLVYRRALRCSSAILISASESDAETLCERFSVPRERTTIVPTAVDTKTFAPSSHPASKLAQETRPPQFAAVSRLSRVKQLHLAIEAFAALKAAYPHSTFLIAGDGEERGHLETRARERVPDGSVRFLGEINREGVAALLRESVALIMPSAAEGFPIAAIESLACGTPVVCNRTGALTEIIQHGLNGFFINPISTIAFARILGEVIEAFPMLGHRCVESIQAFTAERIGRKIEEKLADQLAGAEGGSQKQSEPVSTL